MPTFIDQQYILINLHHYHGIMFTKFIVLLSMTSYIMTRPFQFKHCWIARSARSSLLQEGRGLRSQSSSKKTLHSEKYRNQGFILSMSNQLQCCLFIGEPRYHSSNDNMPSPTPCCIFGGHYSHSVASKELQTFRACLDGSVGKLHVLGIILGCLISNA